MGRRRIGKDLRVTIPVSLDPTVVAELTIRAKTLGTSRSSLANDYIVEGLTDTPNPAIAPQRPVEASQSAPCPHPKSDWQQHTWGKTCGLCGKPVKPGT